MRIAVVGAGISGLGAALSLSEDHDVRVYEQEGRPGGHANTVEVPFGQASQPVDTGFIVYNARNYPNLTSLFTELAVPTKWSDMSFGFSLNGGQLEYACDNADKIFAQRWRAFDPRFLKVVREILHFCRTAPGELAAGRLDGLSLGYWLDRRRYSRRFTERFLLPMGGAIWSTRLDRMLAFPAENFVGFFCNHDLMTGMDSAQRWRTVDGGSREYVRRVHARLGPRVELGRRVVSVDYERIDWVVERVGFEIFTDKVSRRVVFHVADGDREAVHALLEPRVKLTEPTTFLGQALRDWFRR